MRYAASDLDLHCIHIHHKKGAMLNAWVKCAQESVTKFLQGLNIIYFDFWL